MCNWRNCRYPLKGKCHAMWSLCNNDVTNSWSLLWLRFLPSKETKSSLFSIIHILKIIDVCQDNVKNMEKPVRMSDSIHFTTAVSLLWVTIIWHFTKKCMDRRTSKQFIKVSLVIIFIEAKDAQFFSFQGRGQLLLRYYRIFKQYTTLSIGLPVW